MIMKTKIFAWAGSSLFIGATCLSAEREYLRIWNFDEGITSDQGGFFNHYVNSDSTAGTYLNDTLYRGDGGRSWEITATKTDSGFCGAWLHLFPTRDAPERRRYLDAGDYTHLSFWARGERGGEQVTVQMADRSWIDKEDSAPCDPLQTYLPSGITTDWQEVVIPLEDFSGLDHTELGGLTFNFTAEGTHKIYIDDVYLKKDEKIVVPLTPNTVSQKRVTSASKRPLKKAVWVWESHRLLTDEAARRTFFEFCETYGVNDIFFQLHYQVDESDPGAIKTTVTLVDELKSFMRQAHERKIMIQALEGYPDWVMKKNHKYTLSIIQALIEYNEQVAPEERFDGIHLDNEPYLMVGFNDRTYRKKILEEFIELNDKAMKLIKEKKSDMIYGIDIPFWFEQTDEENRINALCEWNGVEKPASYHLLDVVDNIGIMDYRDFAYGADGMIAHGIQEIEYAERVGKEVYIGVETFRYPLITVDLVCGMKSDVFFKKLHGDMSALRDISRMDGPHFRLQFMAAGDYVHVGLERPANMSEEKTKRFHKALLQLARWVGAAPEQHEGLDNMLFDTEYFISKDARWDAFRRKDIVSPDEQERYAGFQATLIMLPKITFDDKTKAEMDRELLAVEKAFLPYSSFIGFAIHYYKTYQAMPDE